MNRPRELRTERLLLRRWRPDDRPAFARLNADPRVAEFLGASLPPEESDAMADRITAHWERVGFGPWAVEVPGITPFAGFVELAFQRFEAHFTPCVEIDWQPDATCWGRGYATERVRAALQFGFESLGLNEIVSFTFAGNSRSRRVMEKISMMRSPSEDFDHPALPEGHRLRPHVLPRSVRPREFSPESSPHVRTT